MLQTAAGQSSPPARRAFATQRLLLTFGMPIIPTRMALYLSPSARLRKAFVARLMPCIRWGGGAAAPERLQTPAGLQRSAGGFRWTRGSGTCLVDAHVCWRQLPNVSVPAGDIVPAELTS